jgi:predicted glycosyltransferase
MSSSKQAIANDRAEPNLRPLFSLSRKKTGRSAVDSVRKKIWIDLENSPHVPFFKPIAEELERRGYSVFFTARDCFQTCELADLMKIEYRSFGRHYGKRTIAKVVGLGTRVLQLMPYVIGQRPQLAVSHGSRSLFMLASMLRIPTVTIMDYEHARWSGFSRKSWAMLPAIIPDEALKISKDRILKYPGIKEDVYAWSFRPDTSVRKVFGIADNDLVVTIRPPATEAHYHNHESVQLLDAVFQAISEHPKVKVILVPRTPKQEAELRRRWAALFDKGSVLVPKQPVDGLDLIWSSDLVVSGGGTMNREAAALGVPVYSVFRGKTGAVDKYLAKEGRLVMLESVEDVRARLKLVRREIIVKQCLGQSSALQSVVEGIIRVAECQC